MTQRRYTKELLAPIVQGSSNYWQVAKGLGLKPNGAQNHRIKALIQEFGISVDHFVRSHGGGRGHNLPANERLVLDRNEGKRESPDRLFRALLALGTKEQCVLCGQGPSWQGSPLRLHVDHINGDGCDNRPLNLRLLCPNCHTQTSTYCGRNKRKRAQTPQTPTL